MIKSTLVYLNTKRGLASAASAALLFSFGMSAAQAQMQSLPTRHTRDAVLSRQARLLGHMDPAQTLHLSIMLPMRDQAGLEAFLSSLYNPTSPNYKQYLSVEEFTRMFGPTEESYYTAIQFAANNGFNITHTAPNRVAFQVDAKVADIEKAFHLTMNVYQHPTENRTFYAPDREPTANVATRLWHVGNMDNYSIPRSMMGHKDPNGAQPNATGSGPGGNFLQSDFRAAYYGSGSLTGTGQKVGVFEFAPYNPAGVTLYFSTYGPSNSVVVKPISVDGTPATCSGNCASQNSGSIEAALDIEVPIAFSPGLSAVNVYVGSDISGVAELNRMVSDNDCKQISCSWLWKPADPTSVDPIFMQMAAQGQTFYTASGDAGSYSAGEFAFPAEDANQISVGGTDLVTNGPGGSWKSETGWIDSGGGPSIDGIPIPKFQKNKKVITATNKASRTLRNNPDVSAEANFDNQICYDSTCTGGYGGTSFAAPRWAGYTALANQQAVTNGDPLVGFADAEFYQIYKGAQYGANFHDPMTGSNGAYSCAVGYDLVTGIGSMNGPTLINTLAP